MRRARRGDTGAGTLEYVGLSLLASAIVVSLFITTPAPAFLGDLYRRAICLISGGECPQGVSPEARQNEYYEPPPCLVSSSETRLGAEVNILVFDAGKEVAFITQRTADGQVQVTTVDADMFGVSTGVGVDANAGPFRIGAEANVGGSMTIGLGDTYTFDSQDEADQFIGDIREQAGIDAAEDLPGPLGWGASAYDHFAGPDLPDPDITREEVSLEASADAGATAGLGRPGQGEDGDGGWQADANIGAEAEVHVGENVVLEHNHETGQESVTYELTGGASAGASVPTQSVGPEGERQGAFKVTRNEDGSLDSLEFTQTTMVDGEMTVVTTNVPLETDAARQTAEDWLDSGLNNSDLTALRVTWDDMAPTTAPGPDADDFARLLYEEGQVSRATYDTETTNFELSGEVKLGLKLGGGVFYEGSEEDLASAEYLAAPRNGERSYIPFENCDV